MVETDAVHFLSERSEGVDVAFPDPPEIAEVDAQLEGRVGGLHERRLVNTKLFDKAADVRQRRLAHADDADFLAFDQLHAGKAGEQFCDPCRRHPARGAAAQDDDTDRFGCI